MELSTRQRLAALNALFYDEHAEDFADSRPRLSPGVRRALARILPGARVLEIGCGDGKVARALSGTTYVGVDSSAAMLARAQRYTTEDGRRKTGEAVARLPSSVVFFQADLLDPSWTAVLPAETFDRCLAFAVFHHVPGQAARQRLLDQLAERLRPGGWLVMSNWQFERSPRLRQRQVPWAALGLSQADVEPGDALLRWERKGRTGLRYVHALSEAEARSLAAAAGLTPVEVFSSDGAGGALAEYVELRR